MSVTDRKTGGKGWGVESEGEGESDGERCDTKDRVKFRLVHTRSNNEIRWVTVQGAQQD